MTKFLINPNAQQLLGNNLHEDDRVLITGASGWFGQTASALLLNSGVPTHLLASHSRLIQSLGSNLTLYKFDIEQIRDFEPTLIIDCAFITRERIGEFGIKEYIRQNKLIMDQLFQLVALPSVNRFVTFSSGAAIHPAVPSHFDINTNPYGYLKSKSEEVLEALSKSLGKSGVVARAWSLSGAYVTKPNSFAFSNFISQSVGGEIIINATRPVFRRYSAVEDLLALSIAEVNKSGFRVIDSEGTLIEVAELARTIVNLINPDAIIKRSKPITGDIDDYFSKTQDWPGLCDEYSFRPLNLQSQILCTYRGIESAKNLKNTEQE